MTNAHIKALLSDQRYLMDLSDLSLNGIVLCAGT